jgi:hypothetical protein
MSFIHHNNSSFLGELGLDDRESSLEGLCESLICCNFERFDIIADLVVKYYRYSVDFV